MNPFRRTMNSNSRPLSHAERFSRFDRWDGRTEFSRATGMIVALIFVGTSLALLVYES